MYQALTKHRGSSMKRLPYFLLQALLIALVTNIGGLSAARANPEEALELYMLVQYDDAYGLREFLSKTTLNLKSLIPYPDNLRPDPVLKKYEHPVFLATERNQLNVVYVFI